MLLVAPKRYDLIRVALFDFLRRLALVVLVMMMLVVVVVVMLKIIVLAVGLAVDSNELVVLAGLSVSGRHCCLIWILL